MINEISNANDHQGQINKPGNRQKDNQPAGTQRDKSGEFNTADVVEISHVKPVPPVSDEKNTIYLSSNATNAQKNSNVPDPVKVTDKTEQTANSPKNDASSIYGERKSGIGKFLDTIA